MAAPGAVRVRVSGIRAKGLRAADRGGTSDPYAVLKCGSEEYRSDVVDKTLDPVWKKNEFVFGAKQDLTVMDAIEVTLYDNDLVGKDSLGTVSLPLGELWTSGGAVQSGWHSVYYKGAPVGSFFANVQMTGYAPPVATGAGGGAGAAAGGGGGAAEEESVFAGVGGAAGAFAARSPSGRNLTAAEGVAAAGTPNAFSRPPNSLVVKIIKARNLIAVDKNGTSDPFVRLQVTNFDELKTTIIDDTVNPEFNQSFSFPVRDRRTKLTITVESHGAFMNDFLGRIVLDVNDYHKPVEEQWIPLFSKKNTKDRPRGELFCSVLWSFDASVPPEACKLELEDDATTDGGSVVEEEEEKKVQEAIDAANEEEEKAREARMNLVVPQGDYQVQVHIIEVRDLKPEDPNGTSDPVVYAEVGGKKRHTKVYKKQTNCVIDETLFFDCPNMTTADLERTVITVSVFDADTITRNDLIGLYTFDLLDIYYRKDHEMWRQWVAVIDPENVKDKGVQGYMKLSIVVMGPGDKLPLHTQKEEDAKDEADEQKAKGKKGSLSELCLMPPALKRETHFLVMSVFRGEGLPMMDKRSLGGLMKSGIDGFVEVKFAGNPKARTKYRSVKGDGNLTCQWNEQLWLPVVTPTMSRVIRLTVWDYDKLAPNDRVGTAYLKFDEIQRAAKTPHWINIYGAPEGIKLGPNKNKMNKYPEFASNWRGRILLAAREDPDIKQKEPESVHKKRTRTPPASVMPVEVDFSVRALVVSGAELPKGGLLGSKKYFVMIRIGSRELSTRQLPVKNGTIHWKELKEDIVRLPVDPSQQPDTFIYLCRGPSPSDRVSYCRLKTSDILAHGFEGNAKWYRLKADPAVGAVDDDERPGTILIRLGIGSRSVSDEDWEADLKMLDDLHPYELRLHVYQGRGLAAADDDGALDPYAKASFMGQTRKTSVRDSTCDPLWYETLPMEVFLPSLQFAPEILVEIFDKDKYSEDDYVGELRINLTAPYIMHSVSTDLPEDLDDPVWLHLQHASESEASAPADHAHVDGDECSKWGSVLVGIQLIRKTSPDEVVPFIPASIEPELEPWYLEIIALGLRDLEPFQMRQIYLPFVEFDVGERSRVTDVRRTSSSKSPSGSNPNFLERIMIPVHLPTNPLFAPSLNMKVFDTRLGGMSKPLIGTASVPLADKLPWSTSFRPPVGPPVAENQYSSRTPKPSAGLAASQRESLRMSTPVIGAGGGAEAGAGGGAGAGAGVGVGAVAVAVDGASDAGVGASGAGADPSEAGPDAED